MMKDDLRASWGLVAEQIKAALEHFQVLADYRCRLGTDGCLGEECR